MIVYGWIPMLTGRLLYHIAQASISRFSVITHASVVDDDNPKGMLHFQRLTHEKGRRRQGGVLLPLKVTGRAAATNEPEAIATKAAVVTTNPRAVEDWSPLLTKVEVNLKTGLAKITYDGRFHYLKQSFAVVRDLFHTHLHNPSNEDFSLTPVETSSEEQAIQDILNQYKMKVVNYHRFVKRHLDRMETRYTGQSAQSCQVYCNCGMGEMLYAHVFLDRFLADDAGYRTLTKVFQTARESLEVLHQRASDVVDLQSYPNSVRNLHLAALTLLTAIALTVLVQWSAMSNWLRVPAIIIIAIASVHAVGVLCQNIPRSMIRALQILRVRVVGAIILIVERLNRKWPDQVQRAARHLMPLD